MNAGTGCRIVPRGMLFYRAVLLDCLVLFCDLIFVHLVELGNCFWRGALTHSEACPIKGAIGSYYLLCSTNTTLMDYFLALRYLAELVKVLATIGALVFKGRHRRLAALASRVA